MLIAVAALDKFDSTRVKQLVFRDFVGDELFDISKATSVKPSREHLTAARIDLHLTSNDKSTLKFISFAHLFLKHQYVLDNALNSQPTTEKENSKPGRNPHISKHAASMKLQACFIQSTPLKNENTLTFLDSRLFTSDSPSRSAKRLRM